MPALPATVLVVDDIASNRLLARATLEDAGYHVVEAASGVAALASFEAARPDCVLLDVRMPGLDGFAVIERMRALPGGAATPILFMTALRDLDTFDRAMASGAFDFLTKPVDPTELEARVKAALLMRRMNLERDELALHLRHQRDHLMRAVLLNERLTSFLVHDLKNPIAGIQLGADLIRNDAASSDKSRAMAARMHAQAGDLLAMVMGLLDLAKAGEGRLELRRQVVALAPIIDDALDAIALRAGARGITLRRNRVPPSHGGSEVFANVDPGMFRRTLDNLLDNALRHTPDGSSINVAATHSEGGVEVRVVDAGRGVPPDLRERIFDRYVQADGVVSRSGRGLGLAFCKAVLDAHGGRIWVEHAGDTPGAVFCTWWPDA